MSRMGGPSTRTRRSTDEVRRLILDAARELFGLHGYQGTSTREIAARAGVVEPMLFRHFGTKAALFERTVLEPVLVFIGDFVKEWSVLPDGEVDPEALHRRYLAGLLRLCREHRPMLAALAAEGPGGEHAGALGRAHALIAEHLGHLTREVRNRARPGAMLAEPHLAVRFTVALIFGAALFADQLFDADEESLVDELAGFVRRGVGYRELT
jgi:AcrR family transcriptional regulator